MARTIVLVLALGLLATVALAPTAMAAPPKPGGSCQVQEEYVTEAYVDGDGFHFGARRPIECYY